MISFLNILLLLSLFPSLIFSLTLTGFTRLNFPSNVTSSGSMAFDVLGQGPYAGTRDGRVLFFSRLTNSFQDFAFTSPNRSATCGYTTGLSFDYLTQKLYAGDTYVGLTVVVPLVPPAFTLLRNTDVVPPFRYLVGVDYATDGMVYLADGSAVYGPRDLAIMISTGDSTGRLLRYDPITRQVTTLLSELGNANGVATSADASFVLVSEGIRFRVLRYWLKGGKAGTNEVFVTFQGRPNKIKRNQEGDFWVGVNVVITNSTIAPQGVKLSPSGQILATVDLSNELGRVTLVIEQNGKLYATAANSTFVGQYNIA